MDVRVVQAQVFEGDLNGAMRAANQWLSDNSISDAEFSEKIHELTDGRGEVTRRFWTVTVKYKSYGTGVKKAA